MNTTLPSWDSQRKRSGEYHPARPDREYIQSQPEPTRVNFVIATDSISDDGSTLSKLASQINRGSSSDGLVPLVEACSTASGRALAGQQSHRLFSRLLTVLGF